MLPEAAARLLRGDHGAAVRLPQGCRKAAAKLPAKLPARLPVRLPAGLPVRLMVRLPRDCP